MTIVDEVAEYLRETGRGVAADELAVFVAALEKDLTTANRLRRRAEERDKHARIALEAERAARRIGAG